MREPVGGGAPTDLPSWQVIAMKRRLRARLEEEIARESREAILDARKAGVPTAKLAELWGVTVTWIYTQAPVRDKTSKKARKTGGTSR